MRRAASVAETMQENAAMNDQAESLSMIIFSGTDDRLTAASTLAVGAAALGRKVDVLLQFWGLDAFRGDNLRSDHGVAPEATPEGAEAFRTARLAHWADVFAQAKEVGEVRIHACAQSMNALGITEQQLDELVDGVEGIAAFMADAEGPVVFI
jgi:peroxiredoxin family protein